MGYREVDIEASDAGRREFDEYGGSGVPLIIVGERRMRGFDAGRHGPAARLGETLMRFP